MSRVTHFRNPAASTERVYGSNLREIVSVEKSQQALQDIRNWPGYCETPLHELDGLANHCKVGQVFYKDESKRFALKSFKALGGSYAVARQLVIEIERATGRRPGIDDLFSRSHADVVEKVTVATATDGNHGRSVAWAAQMFGCSCVIYIHADVSDVRAQAMADFGADVRRVNGNYDDSVRAVAAAAEESGWIVVSDNSYEGYLDIPRYVVAGYTVMLLEAVEQLNGEIPTHVFVQGGCGGLASAVCGFFWDLWSEKRPRLAVVEPEEANCLQQSAQNDRPTVVGGKLETLMAGLACGEVSLLAWEILNVGADDFTTLPERFVPAAMRLLANGVDSDVKLEAGESAVAGVGLLLAASNDDELRTRLGIDSNSRVLLLGTEGATDPEMYGQLLAR